MFWENNRNFKQRLWYARSKWASQAAWAADKSCSELPDTPKTFNIFKNNAILSHQCVNNFLNFSFIICVCLKFTDYHRLIKHFFAWKISFFMVLLNMDIFWHKLFLFSNYILCVFLTGCIILTCFLTALKIRFFSPRARHRLSSIRSLCAISISWSSCSLHCNSLNTLQST